MMSSTVSRRLARSGNGITTRPTVVISSRGPSLSQMRTFRWGMWSSYLHLSLRRDAANSPGSPRRRSGRVIRCKYNGPLHGRFTSDPKYWADGGRIGRHMRYPTTWNEGSEKYANELPGSASILEDSPIEKQETPQNETGVRPGRNIEDVERSAMEYLLYGEKKPGQGEYDFWASPLDNIRSYLSRDFASPAEKAEKAENPKAVPVKSTTAQPSESTVPKASTATDEAVKAAATDGADYIIDPITNRKVLKIQPSPPTVLETESTEPAVVTFKSYRSLFGGFEAPERKSEPEVSEARRRTPVHSDGPVLEGELRDNERQRPVDAFVDPFEKAKEEYEETAVEKLVAAAAAPREPILASDEYIRLLGEKAADLSRSTLEIEREEAATRNKAEKVADIKTNVAEPMEKKATTTTSPPLPAMDDSEPTTSWLNKLRRLSWAPSAEERAEDVDLLRASDVRAGAGVAKKGKSGAAKEAEQDAASRWINLEDEEIRQAQALKEEDSRASLNTRLHRERIKQAKDVIDQIRSKAKPGLTGGLTGNYVRDFPDEFSATWSTTSSPSQSSLYPTGSGVAGSKEEPRPRIAKRNYANETGNHDPVKLMPSLDRFDNVKAVSEIGEPKEEDAVVVAGEPEAADSVMSPADISAAEIPTAREEMPPADFIAARDGVDLTRHVQPRSDKDLVREIREIYEEGYGKIESSIVKSLDALSKSVDGAAASPPPTRQQEPPATVYKILAYDPTMQSIIEAETTSVVPDTASALTPADVLLRLSNPAKFFPHFKPLQDQGFEIVSGSGDVLVFRKVRSAAQDEAADTTSTSQSELAQDSSPASTTTPQADASADTTAPTPTKPSAGVNPIDLMGRDSYSDAAQLAAEYESAAPYWTTSPTGFVNYEAVRHVREEFRRRALEEEAVEKARQEELEAAQGVDSVTTTGNTPSSQTATAGPTAVPFKSNIDVRREEPVFSGGQVGSRQTTKKKRSLARRALIGAAWVGGVSYALGVVGEYFKTGGLDGKGPTGL